MYNEHSLFSSIKRKSSRRPSKILSKKPTRKLSRKPSRKLTSRRKTSRTITYNNKFEKRKISSLPHSAILGQTDDKKEFLHTKVFRFAKKHKKKLLIGTAAAAAVLGTGAVLLYAGKKITTDNKMIKIYEDYIRGYLNTLFEPLKVNYDVDKKKIINEKEEKFIKTTAKYMNDTGKKAINTSILNKQNKTEEQLQKIRHVYPDILEIFKEKLEEYIKNLSDNTNSETLKTLKKTKFFIPSNNPSAYPTDITYKILPPIKTILSIFTSKNEKSDEENEFIKIYNV